MGLGRERQKKKYIMNEVLKKGDKKLAVNVS